MTILMLVWCRAYGCRSVSVCLIFPFFLLVVWICRLELTTHHGASCACVSIIPLWPWGTTSFGAVSASGTYVRTPSCRCSMCLTEWSVRSSEDVFRSVEEMECSNGSDIWAAMVRSDKSAFWRVRRSSAANWGGMAMWEGAGVCVPVACWRRVTAANVGLAGRAWSVQDSSCNAPALVRALVWSFEGLEFGRKRLGCQN